MNKCIMCGAEVFKDIGYVTDGKIFVCDRCAESHSLTRIITRIENSGCDSNIKSCYTAPIKTGLVNQTESAETDSASIGAEAEHNVPGMSEEDFVSKYTDNSDDLSREIQQHSESV